MQRAQKAVAGKKSSNSTSILANKKSFNFNDILKAEKEQHQRTFFLSNKLNERTRRAIVPESHETDHLMDEFKVEADSAVRLSANQEILVS